MRLSARRRFRDGVIGVRGDSDEFITSQVRLETTDEGQTLTFTQLGENAGMAPARYGRCSWRERAAGLAWSGQQPHSTVTDFARLRG